MYKAPSHIWYADADSPIRDLFFAERKPARGKENKPHEFVETCVRKFRGHFKFIKVKISAYYIGEY
jgi:hypothetical protein